MAKPTKKTEVNPDAEVQTNVQAEAQTPTKSKTVKPVDPVEARPQYEEWKVEINGDKFTKLKKMREGITITEEQANMWNEGVLTGGNNYALMYFLPE